MRAIAVASAAQMCLWSSCWDSYNTAVYLAGSPFHMKLANLDGFGQTQDRSLSTDALYWRPECSIAGSTVVSAGTTNAFTAVTDALGGSGYSWALTNLSGTATFAGPANGPGVQVASPEGGAYQLSLKITQRGISSHTNISVQVLPLTVRLLAATNAVISWNSRSNVQYQLEYRSFLSSGNWLNLGTTVTATNTNTFVVDSQPISTQRFYRVRQLP